MFMNISDSSILATILEIFIKHTHSNAKYDYYKQKKVVELSSDRIINFRF